MPNILQGVWNFLFSPGENCWNVYELQTNLHRYSQYRQYPYLSALPQCMYFSSSFWQEVKNSFDLTLKDEHEREISVFYVDGDLVLTKTLRGERSQVVSSHKVSVRYVPQSNTGYFSKEVLVDGQIYSTRTVSQHDLPPNIVVSYLFNMHTHPPHYFNGSHQEQDRYYNFFSVTDLRSFIGSPAAITGLITDEFWILFKTATSPKQVVEYDQQDVTPENLHKHFALGLYRGHFGAGKVERVLFSPAA